MNVDPELRKRVEGILVSPDDIAAIEAVARGNRERDVPDRDSWVDGFRAASALYAVHVWSRREVESEYDRRWPDRSDPFQAPEVDPAEAAHHRMVQPDHYQRWER